MMYANINLFHFRIKTKEVSNFVTFCRQYSVEVEILHVHGLLVVKITVMCLSIGTPKIINFPFVPNGKLIIFRCPKI